MVKGPCPENCATGVAVAAPVKVTPVPVHSYFKSVGEPSGSEEVEPFNFTLLVGRTIWVSAPACATGAWLGTLAMVMVTSAVSARPAPSPAPSVAMARRILVPSAVFSGRTKSNLWLAPLGAGNAVQVPPPVDRK